jgi:hypothetical protein
MDKRYLGDSVYVEIENGTLKLTTNNGYPDDPRNVIYLEPEGLHALNQYYESAVKFYAEKRP